MADAAPAGAEFANASATIAHCATGGVMAYYYHQQRRSIFGGIVLILIGAIFLVHEFNPGIGIGRMFVHYWPLLLILWGVALLIDNLLAGWLGGGRPSAVSGGEIALIVILLLVVAAIAGVDWARKHSPEFDVDMGGMFEHSYNWRSELPTVPAKPNETVSIVTDRGSITVNPASDANLHVRVEKIARAESRKEAQRSADKVQVKITPQGNGYQIQPQVRVSGNFDGASVRTDLVVELPQQSTIHAQTNDGGVRIASISAPVTIHCGRGDVDLHGISGDVVATMAHGNAHFDNVKGNVRLDGHGGEVDLANISGDATIDGEFYGPIRARNVAQTTRFMSAVSNLTVGKLLGQMEMDSGDFSVSHVKGSLTLSTTNKDLTLDDVEGRVDLTDKRGDISLRFMAPPHDDVRIADESGNIDITLPASASFTISAISRDGQIENDFAGSALKSSTSGQTTILQGTYGTGGPRFTLSTTYGTISIHRAK